MEELFPQIVKEFATISLRQSVMSRTTCCMAADSSMFHDWHRPCVPTCRSSHELTDTDSEARSRRSGNAFHWPMCSALRDPQARGQVGDLAWQPTIVYEGSNCCKAATRVLQEGYNSRVCRSARNLDSISMGCSELLCKARKSLDFLKDSSKQRVYINDHLFPKNQPRKLCYEQSTGCNAGIGAKCQGRE